LLLNLNFLRAVPRDGTLFSYGTAFKQAMRQPFKCGSGVVACGKIWMKLGGVFFATIPCQEIASVMQLRKSTWDFIAVDVLKAVRGGETKPEGQCTCC
jgi:hypothetical protein